jgi:hypothetical protein
VAGCKQRLHSSSVQVMLLLKTHSGTFHVTFVIDFNFGYLPVASINSILMNFLNLETGFLKLSCIQCV